MCGRTACTLAPDEICKACCRPRPSENGSIKEIPQWRDHPGKYQYRSSPNMAPSMFSPVLVGSANFSKKRNNEGISKDQDDTYYVQPMMWGLIPPFYKGDSASGYGYKTNNCRIESIEEKKSYTSSLNKGQRCVILCDGFYEWQTTKGDKDKQAYFIHAPQTDGIEVWNQDTWNSKKVWNEKEGWTGPELLKMAGIYSHWTSTLGEDIFTYTVLTMESGEEFSKIHHRIPAIFDTFADAEAWLDSSNLDYKSLLSSFSNTPNIEYYPVSSLVNNSRNQDPSCMVPISLDEKKVPNSASSKFMTSWLNSSSSPVNKTFPLKNREQKETKPKGILKYIKKEEKK